MFHVLVRVIRVILVVLVVGFSVYFILFLADAFLFGEPWKMVLATLSWLWQVKLIQNILILIGLWMFARIVGSMIDERERIAQERHEQILKALDQIADKLGDHDDTEWRAELAEWDAHSKEELARANERIDRIVAEHELERKARRG